VKETGKSFVWHFLIDRDRERMTYNKGLGATALRTEVEEVHLQAGRHFVGWTRNVDVLAGR
jgi:hypothetical protein